MKHVPIITWSQLGHPSFSQESVVCTKQDWRSEYRMLPSVTIHIVHQVCSDVGCCVKSGSCSLSSLKWKVTISTNVSCYQTLCRQQYYLPFINTAHACTSAWCAPHSLTAAAQNSQLHFCWAMAPTGQSWTQLITRFTESTAACIWVSSQQN